MINKYYFFLFFICFPQFSWAQHISLTPTTALSIQESDSPFVNGFNGGINAAQFFEIDLNLDGREELVIFDRVSRKVSTYEFSQDKWVYTPKYNALFPSNIRFWLCVLDLDNDGKKDLIIGEDDGVYFYKNNSSSNQFSFSESPKIIYSTTFSGASTPLLSSLLDTPAFYDIDNDGKLDFFTFVPSLGGTIEYHKNIGVDENNAPNFKKITNNWGNFHETGDCATYIFGDQQEASNYRIQHLGSSITLYDVSRNGLTDVLIGEMSCSNLVAIPNKGSVESPLFNESIIDFPSNNPINITMFPAAFFVDFNKNGEKDMLISQSITSNEGDLNDFSESTWLYTLNDREGHKTWDYITSGILQEFDLGERTCPFSIDIDKDGNTDLLVGYRNTFTNNEMTSGGIAYLRNIGSNLNPKFDVIDRNYLLLQDWEKIDIKPFILDFDNNGEDNLIISARTPNTNEAGLYLFSKNGNSFSISNPQKLLEHRPEENISLYDINKDGLIDVLIGTFSGEIKVYLQKEKYQFELTNDTFFSSIESDLLRKYPSVFIDQLDGNDSEDLLIMDDSGKPRIWRGYNSISEMNYQNDVLYSDLLSSFTNTSIGKRNIPAKIGNHLILGTESGGLLSTVIGINESPTAIQPPFSNKNNVKVYPNPTFGEVTISNSSSEGLNYTILSLHSKVIKTGKIEGNETHKFSTSTWTKGIYIVQFKNDNNSIIIKKLIVK